MDTIRDLFNGLIFEPVARFWLGLAPGDWPVLVALLAIAGALGFEKGRRRVRGGDERPSRGGWRVPAFQNGGEALVARVIRSHFRPPDYHLMNHVTLRMDDGTTQVDHILVSRFGVFVIETKDFSGWIFANAAEATWIQVLFRRKSRFQNPIHQNYRHVLAVRALLDFLPPEAIKSLVVFSGSAEFRTDMPPGVTTIGQLPACLGRQTEAIMSRNRQQFCVGRLETERLAISRQTDVEHVESLARRHGSGRSLFAQLRRARG